MSMNTSHLGLHPARRYLRIITKPIADLILAGQDPTTVDRKVILKNGGGESTSQPSRHLCCRCWHVYARARVKHACGYNCAFSRAH